MHKSANLDGKDGVDAALSPASSGAGERPWRRYLATLAATFAALLGAYTCVLAGLQRTGNLPPPSIANEICADEKLRWLREDAPEAPNTLLVGSSIAFRNIDASQLAARDASARPLNGGMCHMQVNQSAFVARYLLRHFPSVRTVTAVLAPQDFVGCANTPAQAFDPQTADAYVFERRWPYFFYLRQFDAVSLARNAGRIREMRSWSDQPGGLAITRYGDGPDTEAFRGLVYAKLTAYDPVCFASLRDLAEAVTRSGRRFVAATSPVHPDWSARFDGDGRLRRELDAGIRAALHGTGAEFWDGDEAFAGAAPEFTDAIHVKWSAARRYGALLAAALDARQERP